MKRVRSINGDTSGRAQNKATTGGGGKKGKMMMAANAAAAENLRPDLNPAHPDAEADTSIISTAAISGLAAAVVVEQREEEEAAAAVREYYYNNCGGVVNDYDQMWWGSVWLPIWDVENYLVDDEDDDFIVGGDDAADAANVGWDIDDIWNLKGIK